MEEHNHTIQYIIAHQIDQSQSVCSKKDYDKKTLFYSLVIVICQCKIPLSPIPTWINDMKAIPI